jgi:hypothetical protein
MRRGRTTASVSDAVRYTTPDGKFTLVVVPADDLLGFEEYPWHTHGAFLPSVYQLDSIPNFLDALFDDRLVMAVSQLGDSVRDVRVTADPQAENESVMDGETLELRYWSGRPYHAD